MLYLQNGSEGTNFLKDLILNPIPLVGKFLKTPLKKRKVHIHVSILFQVLLPFRLLQNMEESSLCYTVGLCWLSILNIAVCICQSQPPNLSLPHFPW